jgi:putative endonuclease
MNLGKYGEGKAKKFLTAMGYELLKQNYRYDRAEIDLVFKDEINKVLIFTEVKTRRTKTFGEPEDSVTIAKQKQLRKSAEGFISQHGEFSEYEKRFDVVTIYINRGKEDINHIVNAF